ncbi:MAG: response regulator [Candidatus Cloacimonetes bacterium]|nr:response regulator [Candidatus Cloacimonadota bacterium]MCF7814387.1 response regulator [Candidatus Cloacimonadota bacterium]MCF7868533.1 response regulator [Candidatus Cloacimonadota bacterium]MCF7884047.1 response regulator [Candidatus Cloacimonadota bacterium]
MKIYSFKNIKSRIRFWFYFMSIIPLLIALTITYLQRSEAIKMRAENKLVAVRDMKIEQIREWFLERRGDLNTIASDLEIREISDIMNKEQKTATDLYRIKVARNLIKRLMLNFRAYSEIFIIDAEKGVIQISTNSENEGISKISEPYFKNPLNSGDFCITDIYYSKSLKKTAMAFSIPINPEDSSEINSILVARIDLENSIYKILNVHAGLGETGENLIVDENSIALSNLRWKKADPLTFQIEAFPAQMGAAGISGTVKTKDYRGSEVIAAYSHIPEFNWGIVSKQDAKELYAPLYKMVLNYFFLFLILVIVISIILRFLTNSIVVPINRLIEFAQRVRNEDFSARLHNNYNDEYKLLADTFNKLAEVTGAAIQIQKSVNSFSGKIIRTQSRQDFASVTLTELMAQTSAQMAVYYVQKDESEYFVHFYSIGANRELWQSFNADKLEGELGMAIQSKRIYRIQNIPQDTIFKFNSTLAEIVLNEIICIPILVNEEVKAVITLGCVQKLREDQMEMISRIWLNINAVYSRLLASEKVEKLVAELQNKNEELQSQAEELQEQTEELQSQAEELQLNSEELQQQNTELEMQRRQVAEANQLKSEFLSNMSHELRTPLNSILALSRVLIDQGKSVLNHEQLNYLEIVERNGKNLLKMINEILDLSKIEAGKMNIAVSKFSLSNLLQDILDGLRPLADEKKIKLKYKPKTNLPPIESDEQKLYQVLMNIINNAIKFTEKGKVKIDVEKQNDKFYIEISDTGIGISKEALPYIFDEFRQADGTASRKFEGTGLGLAISYKLMSILGGDIEVKSKIGEGSTFTVIIPLKIDSIENGIKIENRKTKKKNSDHIRKKNHLLIVEDNPTTIIQIKEILQQEGFSIEIAEGGRQALDYVEERIPDGIILDLMMPDVDGFEVLETIRSKPETENIPVLILTAKNLTNKDLKKLTSNNIQQLVQKGDINRTGFLNKISEMMSEEESKFEVGKTKASVKNGKPKILIIEDDPDSVITLKAILKDNYDILEANDGEAGLRKAVFKLPDVILLDINLPKMDGTEIAGILKNSADTKHIKIIAVTARVMPEDKEYILASGCDGFISKPVDKKDLITEIEKQMRILKKN